MSFTKFALQVNCQNIFLLQERGPLSLRVVKMIIESCHCLASDNASINLCLILFSKTSCDIAIQAALSKGDHEKMVLMDFTAAKTPAGLTTVNSFIPSV